MPRIPGCVVRLEPFAFAMIYNIWTQFQGCHINPAVTCGVLLAKMGPDRCSCATRLFERRIRMKSAVASSKIERRKQGKALREKLPRTSQAEWKPRSKSQDIVKLLEESDADRIPGLIPVKYQRMAESAFKFFRGQPSSRRATSQMPACRGSQFRRVAIAT